MADLIVLYILTLTEYVILKTGGKSSSKLALDNGLTSFNFTTLDTKITYAKTKFLVSLAALLLYYPGSLLFFQ